MRAEPQEILALTRKTLLGLTYRTEQLAKQKQSDIKRGMAVIEALPLGERSASPNIDLEEEANLALSAFDDMQKNDPKKT